MVTAIEGITLQQGLDPADAVMIGGGGGAGLYSIGVARRLGITRIVIPDVAAAISAAGELLSDIQGMYAETAVLSTARFDVVRAAAILSRLRARAEAFVKAAGASDSEIRFGIEARYPHQVWEIEIPLRGEQLATPEDVEMFRLDFHAAHDELFAVSDVDSAVELVTWRAHVRCRLRGQEVGPVDNITLKGQGESRRRAYFPNLGYTDTPVKSMEALPTSTAVTGPLLVDTPVTTIVVDERATVERLPTGGLLLYPSSDASAR
jgi:N-methylhydantoinase A